LKCDIYFSQFDTSEINAKGWGCEEGDLLLRLTNPLGEDGSIRALDEALDKGKYRFVGSLDLEDADHAWLVVQNIDERHPLNDRSMMVGDVVICDKKIGKIVEPMGWSDLSQEQINKFENFIY